MTMYSFRINKHNSLVIAKWGDYKEPLDVYTITNRGKGMCDCWGSARHPYCKHKQLIEEVLPLSPLVGSFYDFDAKLLYTPEDGEGMLLTGAVDIVEAAQAQGYMY